MGGGLMQLVAYGAQDIYLTGNPQITFFKVVYRRHTNFSMEAIAQSFNGQSEVPTSDGQTNQASATISRNGDLIHKMYVTIEGLSSTVKLDKGSALVKEAELEIGGQKIDRHYDQWNTIWNELSTPESKAIGLKSMIGDIGTAGSTGVTMTQYPLNFWFCRNPGLALPLIALQYHEVKVLLTLANPMTSGGSGPANTSVKLFVDYIYLDTDERRRFAQVSHEYLIEQVQRQAGVGDDSQKLVFNHPVKELIWTDGDHPTTEAQLKLNGHDRFSKQKAEYFQLRQPFDYHTAVPRQNLPLAGRTTSGSLSSAGDLKLLSSLSATAAGTGGTDEIFISDGVPASVVSSGLEAAHGGASLENKTIALVMSSAGDAGEVTAGGADVEPGDLFFGVVSSRDSENNFTIANGGFSNFDGSKTLTKLVGSGSSDATFKLYEVDNKVALEARTSKMEEKINVYSFALKPEEHQPSGTCNFSRIDTAILDVTGGLDGGFIYAVNYNVLRIMSGMGGLAYSN